MVAKVSTGRIPWPEIHPDGAHIRSSGKQRQRQRQRRMRLTKKLEVNIVNILCFSLHTIALTIRFIVEIRILAKLGGNQLGRPGWYWDSELYCIEIRVVAMHVILYNRTTCTYDLRDQDT